MQKTRWLLLTCLGTALTFSQTQVDLRTQSKSVDFSGASSTKPFKSGTSLPVSCGAGEMFFKTDAPAGANLYGCVASNPLNFWSPESISFPAVSGSAGKFLSTDGTSFLFSAPGGDVSGQVGALTVGRIQGIPVAPTIPVSGQFLGWNNASNRWEPQAPPVGGTGLPAFSGNAGKLLSTDGSGALWSLPGGDITGPINFARVNALQGLPVAPFVPSAGQFLGWNNIANRWEPLATPSFPSLGGDLFGQASAATVTRIQGQSIAPTVPASGQFLGWNNTNSRWEPQAPPVGGSGLPPFAGNAGKLLSTDGSGALWSLPGGDITGPLTSAKVNGLQGQPVAPFVPSAGQYLGWNNLANRWEPQAPTAAGDVSGPIGSTKVSALQGLPVAPTVPSAGQFLGWNNLANRWEPLATPSFPSLGGDLSGQATSATVTRIQNQSIAPTVPASGQFLGWNNTNNRWEPQAPPVGGSGLPPFSGNAGKLLSTDGSGALWSLPGGDITGPLTSAKVNGLQGLPVAAFIPTAGQFLGWNNLANRWEPLAPPSGGSGLPSFTNNAGKYLSTDGSGATWSLPAGDVTGPITSSRVGALQGLPVAPTVPSSGQFLGWNNLSNRWEPLAPPSVPALGGDLSGQAASATVTRIQNQPIAPTVPAAGQVLGWNGSSNRWEPQTPASGGGSGLPSVSGNNGKVLATDGATSFWAAPGGDISGQIAAATVTQIQGRPIGNLTPSTGQVLTWNGLTSRWEPQNPPTGGTTGSGASLASQLGDLQVVRSNATTLSIGSNCAFSTPCNVRFGGVTYSFTSGATAALSSGSGFAYVYVDKTGTLTIGHNLALTCSGGCSSQTGVTSFPTDAIPLFTWSATNGSWDALGLDQRAFLSTKNILAGAGIATTELQGQTMIAVDPSAIAFRAPAPATAAAACSPGNFASDVNFYYVCVAVNTWKRTALVSW